MFPRFRILHPSIHIVVVVASFVINKIIKIQIVTKHILKKVKIPCIIQKEISHIQRILIIVNVDISGFEGQGNFKVPGIKHKISMSNIKVMQPELRFNNISIIPKTSENQEQLAGIVSVLKFT